MFLSKKEDLSTGLEELPIPVENTIDNDDVPLFEVSIPYQYKFEMQWDSFLIESSI